jgi:tetratricopeptide (TPR) repeat protein
MKTGSTVCALIVAAQCVALPQISSTRIPGVQEPPELMGEPKSFTPPSEAMKQFAQALRKDYKNIEQIKTGRDGLTKLLQENPEYSDGFLMRALFNRCMLNSEATEDILKDINTAISTYAMQKFPRSYESLADHHSFRAKVEFDTGNYQAAMDDLEAAMKQKLDDADKIFNSGGTKPDATSPNICTWSLSDLDLLVRKFPRDYRTLLFRGLYLSFFSTFDEKYYQQAISELQGAATANPKSPLPHFFMGRLYAKASFWTKSAWASEEGKNEPSRKALMEYTNAIRLDANLRVAYARRASSYLLLKQYREAIVDYDKVLQLDPENITAYSDRGLAKLELGEYYSAISDFSDSIRKQKPNSEFLELAYENRADAYTNVGNSSSAISDLDKAIEQDLAKFSIIIDLRDFRAIYPEYRAVADEALVRKIQALFWPELSYEDLSKQLLENKYPMRPSQLADLYVKRGDAYLKAQNFRKAVAEYNRAFSGFGEYWKTIERWRLMASSASGEDFYLDVKTLEFSGDGPARLWLKVLSKKPTHTVDAYEVDCKAKRINQVSTAVYDSNNDVVTSTDLIGGWQRVIPETMGEQLYNGMCSANP